MTLDDVCFDGWYEVSAGGKPAPSLHRVKDEGRATLCGKRIKTAFHETTVGFRYRRGRPWPRRYCQNCAVVYSMKNQP